MTKMLGWDVAGFADIQATALNAACQRVNLGGARRLLRDDDGIAFRLHARIGAYPRH